MAAFIAVHVWQSTLILVAAWLLTLAFRRNAAEIRYWIWFAAAAKFLVPLALLQWLGEHLGRSLPEPLAVDVALIETANAIFAPSIPGGLPVIQTVLGAVWVVGIVALCLRWFLQWRAVRSALTRCSQISIDAPAPVYVTSGDLAPGVFGIFRPVVILPRAVLRELDPDQLRAVLAHEACHIHRRDNLMAAIHKCVEAIFWFHPLVWWASANLLRERETACDESVIEAGHEQRVYAESILSVCRLGVTARFSGAAASTGGDLVQRVSSIMSEQRAQPIGHWRSMLLFAVVTLAGLAPFAAGIVTGALREGSDYGPVTFDVITLKPSTDGWRHTTRFDRETGSLVLKHVSLRQLIESAYPWSRVNGERDIIDRARYDIEARWHDQAGASKRVLHRELLRKVLRDNFNVQLYVYDQDRERTASAHPSRRRSRNPSG